MKRTLAFVVLSLSLLCLFSTSALARTIVDGETPAGAFYRFAVPEGWTPADAPVIWNHGFSLDPVGPVTARGIEQGDLGNVAGAELGAGREGVQRVRPRNVELPEGCTPDATTLCLLDSRFQVRVNFETPDGQTGSGQAVPQTSDTGVFWFFRDTNLELMVKVLDARSFAGHFWVFYGSLTNVEFTLTVTDTETEDQQSYFNPQGNMASFADVTAFPDDDGGPPPPPPPAPASIENGSFESGAGWSNLRTGESPYYAPVAGDRYATLTAGDPTLSQSTSRVLGDAGTVTVTAWARSIYTDAQLDQIRKGTLDRGPTTRAVVEMELRAGGVVVGSTTRDVSPVALQGAPARYSQDDGGNVWIDGGYRMATGPGNIFYQRIADDPIGDPWTRQGPGPAIDNAFAPIVTPQGLRAIYGGFYDDTSPDSLESFIDFVTLSGAAPSYQYTIENAILENVGSEDPWVIDAHLYYDRDTEKLWMTWGGHRI